MFFYRLIVLAEEPFAIVHANAAFTALTGHSAIKAQGQPLQNLTQGMALLEALRSAPGSVARVSNCVQTFRAKTATGKRRPLTCYVSVSPIGQERAKTHFALELRSEDYSSVNLRSASSSPLEAERPYQVLG